jgi:spermidine synthase
MSEDARPAAHKYAAIGLVACSMLMHEILLTRICALRLYFHFAFLVISNCLLGLGASGALLAIHQERFRREPRLWLGRFTLMYAISLPCTFFFLRGFPLPPDLVLSEPSHFLALSAFNLVGALPFVFGGAVVGMILSFDAKHVDRLYAVDLVGAGIGCIGCPLLLPRIGAGGVFVCTALLALAAAMIVVGKRWGVPVLAAGAVLFGLGLASLPSLDRRFPIPSKGWIDLARAFERVYRLGAPYSVWTSNSRIDLVRAPAEIPAFIFMRGSNRRGLPKDPPWASISQDATAGTMIANFSQQPQALALLDRTMYSAAYRLEDRPRVLVIGLGGGNDVWAAKQNGARSVKAIELNWPIVAIHEKVMRSYSKSLVEDRSVRFVVDEGRSALMRETQHYDVIQMSGIDTWTALASGAYVLAENYLYTREAIASMYMHLAPGGILQIARFAETMEALRLLSNIHAALTSLEAPDLASSVMALATSDKMMAIELKRGTFTQQEQQSTLDFAQRSGIDVVYMPSRRSTGPLEDFIRSSDKQRIIDAFPMDISPTNDDRPYFFNYTKWRQPIESIRYLGHIPSVSQGNPFFILSQLLLSIVLSAALILVPLAKRVHLQGRRARGYLLYFSGLGLGFISIEIAVIQKLTLFLGQPVYSLTVTLFSLLVFTGLGSLGLAGRFGRLGRGDRRIWLVPLAIALYLGLFALGSETLVARGIGLSLPLRISLTTLSLAPLGLLLGVPFAYGMRLLDQEAPELAPLAWAINGCLSVVGSILTVVISMNFGFASVLWTAAAVYIAAFASLWVGRAPLADA